MATITSANSVLSIAVQNLYPIPQTIQGYAADDAFSAGAIDQAEIVMGVDGKMSAGFVFNPVAMTINIMADSPSLDIFLAWKDAQRTAKDIYPCNATIVLPAIRKKFTLTNGVLTSAPQFPDVKKTLQPSQFTVTFERVVGESY